MTTIYTDIHAHVLPNLDDGPESILETEQLLQAMYHGQVQRVFTTAHYRSPHFDVHLSNLQDTFTQIRSEFINRDDVPMLAEGAEVRLSSEFREDLRNDIIPQLGTTRYVLVEFPSTDIPSDALSLVYELQIRKFIPIMAHPERNIAIQKNPKLVDELKDSGLLMQATASCFLSTAKSRRPVQLAWDLLENGQIDFIASDAHNVTTRPPGLIEAYDAIAHRLGQRVANQLIDNANAVWEDQPCHEVASIRAPKSSWLSRLRRRQPTH